MKGYRYYDFYHCDFLLRFKTIKQINPNLHLNFVTLKNISTINNKLNTISKDFNTIQ